MCHYLEVLFLKSAELWVSFSEVCAVRMMAISFPLFQMHRFTKISSVVQSSNLVVTDQIRGRLAVISKYKNL